MSIRGKTFADWARLFVKLILISVLAVSSSFILLTLANYVDSVKKLTFYFRINDSTLVNRELLNLSYFYDLSGEWRVLWLADKYLFVDAPFYEADDFYLIGDWEKAKDRLKDKLDDPRSYSYGHAKFRQAQIQYKAGKIKETLGLALPDVAGDFEKALRNCLDSGVPYNRCFDRVWDYDLITDKKAAEEAMKNPKPQIKYILGPPKVKDGDIPLVPPGDKPGGIEKGQFPGSPEPRKRP